MPSKAICYKKWSGTRNIAKANSKYIRPFIFIYMSSSWSPIWLLESAAKSSKRPQEKLGSFIYWNLKGNVVLFSPLSKSQEQRLKHPVKANSNKELLSLKLKKLSSQETPTSTTKAHLTIKIATFMKQQETQNNSCFAKQKHKQKQKQCSKLVSFLFGRKWGKM